MMPDDDGAHQTCSYETSIYVSNCGNSSKMGASHEFQQTWSLKYNKNKHKEPLRFSHNPK